VGKAGEFFEHVASVSENGLPKIWPRGDLGVGANDDAANGAGGDEFGFSDGKTLDESVGGFAG